MMELKFATAGTRVTIEGAAYTDDAGTWEIVGPGSKRGTVNLHRWRTVKLDGITPERHEYYMSANGYDISPKQLAPAPRVGLYPNMDDLFTAPAQEEITEVEESAPVEVDTPSAPVNLAPLTVEEYAPVAVEAVEEVPDTLESLLSSYTPPACLTPAATERYVYRDMTVQAQHIQPGDDIHTTRGTTSGATVTVQRVEQRGGTVDLICRLATFEHRATEAIGISRMIDSSKPAEGLELLSVYPFQLKLGDEVLDVPTGRYVVHEPQTRRDKLELTEAVLDDGRIIPYNTGMYQVLRKISHNSTKELHNV